jgi:hypothetical protein
MSDLKAWREQGVTLAIEYERTGEPKLLAQAVELFRRVASSPVLPAPARAGHLSNLVNALVLLFERTGDTAVLEEAVTMGRAAVDATRSGPERAGSLSSLAAVLDAQFSQTGDLTVLQEAAQAGRAAVTMTPQGDPDRLIYLHNYGGYLRRLADHTGDAADLVQAAQILRDALDGIPSGDPGRAATLTNLGNTLNNLYERTADCRVLREAIDAAREAADITPPGHPYRARCLHGLVSVLRLEYERSGDMSLLAEEARWAEEALRELPDGHPDRAIYLSSLSSGRQTLAERTGDASSLDEAVHGYRAALEATPASHPGRPKWLNNLGTALLAVFERTGELELLQEAVQAGRDCLAATPQSHPDRAAFLTNLGNALHSLYDRTGDSAVLDEAVRTAREAVAVTQAGHVDQAGHLSNLGTVLRVMFERARQPAAINEAVQAGREAVAAAPAGAPLRATYLNNLGVALRLQHGLNRDPAVLEETVRTARAAVDATPAGHPEYAGNLSNLSGTLQYSYRQTGNAAALAEAINIGRRAAAVSPAGSKHRAEVLSNLAHVLRAEYERSGDAAVLAEAARWLQLAAGDAAAAALVRFEAYRSLARLPADAGRSVQEALAEVEEAVALLPQLAPAVLARADREHSLGRLMSFAGDAAAAAVAAGKPARAAELLEQTRGILVADQLDARGSDLARLRAAHPRLAGEIDQARHRISVLSAPAPGRADPDSGLAEARRAAGAAWENLLGRIRATSGFADFMRPPSAGTLTAQAKDGPVVFVYTNPGRCGALILTPDPAAPVRAVPLPLLTETDAFRQAQRLLDAESALVTGLVLFESIQAEMLDVLQWEWDAICGPVLSALGWTTAPAEDGPWPHVWWCPVGLLAYLPLHAAGRYLSAVPGGDSGDTVLDRVVSSYIPSVRGLSYARSRGARDASGGTLVVPVPDAPGTPTLAFVSAETDAVKDCIPDATVLARPTRSAVMQALPSHSIVHFSCHGHADMSDPAGGQLILYDHQANPLTVADIGALQIDASLAYLSACETTRTSPALANEAVHITGAFHLAGYRHVIGTLWPVSDEASVEVASDFYRHLTRSGTQPVNTGRAALALHHAIRRLRKQTREAPFLWAPYTHTGG